MNGARTTRKAVKRMKTVEQILWVFVVWLTAALIGYFCWQAGRKYGQNEVLESLAKANYYTDDCLESEAVDE